MKKTTPVIIPQHKKTIETVKMDDLKHFPGNPRHNNKSAKMVAKSIERFGYINYIVVDEENVILAGNTRFKAMKLLGQTEIEVLKVHGLTDEQKKSFVILDNRVGEFSKWNATSLERMVSVSEDKDTLKEFNIHSIQDTKKELEKLLESDKDGTN